MPKGVRIPDEVRRRAQKMREAGATYPEIIAATGIQKSSLHFVLRNVKIPPAVQKQLEQRRAEASRASALRLAAARRANPKPKSEVKRDKPHKSYAKCTPEERAAVRRANAMKASLTYRAKDLPIKKRLEAMFKCVFKKEYVDGIVIPFASKKLLVAVSTDDPTSLLITRRFAVVSSLGDKRKRIAYIHRLGGKAEDRLRRLKVDVRPASDLGLPMHKLPTLGQQETNDHVENEDQEQQHTDHRPCAQA